MDIRKENFDLTIKDIAKMANVSSATISRYLNGQFERMSKKTAEKIAAIITETGFVVNATARQLSTKSSGLVAIAAADIDDYFSTEFFKGASSILEQNEFTAILFDSNSDLEREKRNLNIINHQLFDGLIIQPLINDYSIFKKMVRPDLITVLLDRQLAGSHLLTVKTNNYQISLQAAEHFLNQGFDNCVIISEPVFEASTRQERFKGIKQIYKNAVLIEIDHWQPYLKEKSKELLKLIQNLHNQKSKTLFFFLKERLLLDFFPTFLHENLLDQGDLAITAFSDTAIISRLLPDYLMIKQNPFLMGATAAEIISHKIKGDKEKSTDKNEVIVPADLV